MLCVDGTQYEYSCKFPSLLLKLYSVVTSNMVLLIENS